MTCLNPMFAKRSAVPNSNGKYELSNFVSYRDPLVRNRHYK